MRILYGCGNGSPGGHWLVRLGLEPPEIKQAPLVEKKMLILEAGDFSPA